MADLEYLDPYYRRSLLGLNGNKPEAEVSHTPRSLRSHASTITFLDRHGKELELWHVRAGHKVIKSEYDTGEGSPKLTVILDYDPEARTAQHWRDLAERMRAERDTARAERDEARATARRIAGRLTAREYAERMGWIEVD